MGKLIGVVFIIVGIVVFAPAVAAGISLSTGMTIAGVSFLAVGVICLK